jgi:ERF superfamily
MSDSQSAAPGVPHQQDIAAPPSEPGSTYVGAGGGGLLAMIERLATNPQLNVEVFDRLLAARRQEEDRAAKRAFFAALALAKSEFTPIIKTRQVDYEHKDGRGRTKYKYEELADITDVVMPILAKYAITHSFKVDQSERPKIKVSCMLAHADGYVDEPRTLEGVEDTSGQKSPNQAIASTVTFMERGTLKQALGLAAGRDEDGRSDASPPITTEQANELQKLIDDTGRSQATLLKLVGVENILDMNVDQYTRAKQVLAMAKADQKRKAPGNDNAPGN